MAYLDPMATNQALKKLGSDYQMPDAAPAPAPAVAVNPVAPVEAPKPAAPAAPEPSGFDTAATVANTAGDIVGQEKGSPLKKIGSAIGMIASLYTGNIAGAAASAKGLAG